MKLPNDLLQKAQNNYVGDKYREGMYTFPSLDEQTIATVVQSFLEWAEERGLIKDGSLDVTLMQDW